ncbi:Protein DETOXIFICATION 20, partial [Ananas comosus]
MESDLREKLLREEEGLDRPAPEGPAPAPEAKEEEEEVAEGEEEEGIKRKLVEENKKLWVVAGPSICTRFSTFGVTVITQAFIGHIGATELAAYALVSTVLMRFANGIL